MKKLLSFALAVMFVVMSAGYVFASEGGIAYTRGQDARIKIVTYTYSVNAQSTASTIVEGTNRILGFMVTGSAASGAGLYGTTSVVNANAGTGIIIEANCAAGTGTTVMFPTPLAEWDDTLYVLTVAPGSAISIFYE